MEEKTAYEKAVEQLEEAQIALDKALTDLQPVAYNVQIAKYALRNAQIRLEKLT